MTTVCFSEMLVSTDEVADSEAHKNIIIIPLIIIVPFKPKNFAANLKAKLLLRKQCPLCLFCLWNYVSLL